MSPLLAWAEAVPYLRYEFDAGYGVPGCEALYAWTASWVIFVDCHDGSTAIQRVPRHPVPCDPIMLGEW